MKENNLSLVWSVRDGLDPPPILTSDQLYIRFIGNRSIAEKDFGKIVKDRNKELLEYAKRIRELQDEQDANIRDVLIAFNNHFAGFGPQSVDNFLKIMNMSELNWKRELEKIEKNNPAVSTDKFQSSLSDFNHY